MTEPLNYPLALRLVQAARLLSSRELAARVGRSEPTVCKWLRGTQKIPREMLGPLCGALQVSRCALDRLAGDHSANISWGRVLKAIGVDPFKRS